MRTHEGLIGRDHPIAVLHAEIGRVADSHGGLVLVTGEAGIGKTTLVTVAAEEARRRGALVLGGACWDSPSAPGYWPWVQVVRALRRTATPDEWSAARDAGGTGLGALLGEATEEELDDFSVSDAVTTALVAVSQHRPVLVVLDDLHWADLASLRLLEFAAQHTWFEKLLLVGTYRDAEAESSGHPLRPLIMPLVAKATTVTLTGLGREDVAALMTRTAGRAPGDELVTEVHRRTGGNPFFVEQTARLWRVGGSVTAIAPGVRDAVRRRLALLPEAVVDLLTTAGVLGREFDVQVLTESTRPDAPAGSRVDARLGEAETARLVRSLGGGRYAFAHDLVRETLYDALDPVDRRRRHARVVEAIDRTPTLARRLVPADVARHAYLAGDQLPADRVVEHLLAAGYDAGRRLAVDEELGHFRRAYEVVVEPAQRVKVALALGQELRHRGQQVDAAAYFAEAADVARGVDDPELLARVALTIYRFDTLLQSMGRAGAELIREAHDRWVGGAERTTPVESLAADLIASTERSARHGRDDEALSFSLWTRHDTIWGLGTARERDALTIEMADVARRSGDRETELFAASLRWVALLEMGDPAYHDQFVDFVALGERLDLPRTRMATSVDRSIIAAFRGDFGEAEDFLDGIDATGDHGHADHAYMGAHLRWALALLRGRFDEAERVLAGLGDRGHPYGGLLRGITAAERGDLDTARRVLGAGDGPYPRFMTPLSLRLRARVAAATGDHAACAEVRAELAPYRGEWAVSFYGCDIGGPVDLWLAILDAACGRWDEARDGFERAVEAAERMGSPPWSVLAREEWAKALAARDEHAEAERLRADAARDAAALGMRLASVPEADEVGPARSAENEFRPDGPVWTLAFAGVVTHLPDAKGLRDLRELLRRPGVDIPAVELLDPAAGPELVAARRLGAAPILDDRAKAHYQRRLSELDDQIDRAVGRGDDERAARFDEEREALLTELRAAAGLAGRTRRLGDEAERARKTVTARIRDTLRKLDDRHPALAAHLREAVSTGAVCRYAPTQPVTWRL